MRQVSRARMEPASVNRYLLPREHSGITVRMHPAVLAGPLIVISGGLVAARKLASRSGRPDIVWGAYLLLLLDFSRRVAAWPETYFVVTNERMLLIRGPLLRTVAAMSLGKATGLTLQRTVLGRLLGYGSLIVVSPGRRRAFRKVRHLPYPEQLFLEVSGLLSPDAVAGPEQGEGASCEVDLDPGF
jgi:Bacterial PH domain